MDNETCMCTSDALGISCDRTSGDQKFCDHCQRYCDRCDCTLGEYCQRCNPEQWAQREAPGWGDMARASLDAQKDAMSPTDILHERLITLHRHRLDLLAEVESLDEEIEYTLTEYVEALDDVR